MVPFAPMSNLRYVLQSLILLVNFHRLVRGTLFRSSKRIVKHFNVLDNQFIIAHVHFPRAAFAKIIVIATIILLILLQFVGKYGNDTCRSLQCVTDNSTSDIREIDDAPGCICGVMVTRVNHEIGISVLMLAVPVVVRLSQVRQVGIYVGRQ